MPSRRRVKSPTIKYGLSRLQRFQTLKVYSFEISKTGVKRRSGITLIEKEK